MNSRLKAQRSKQQRSKVEPKSVMLSALSFQLLVSCLLLLALSFQLLALICCPAWAESEVPRLTPAVQRVVYEAQQSIEKKEYLEAEECLKGFIEKNRQKPHYLVEFTLANLLAMAGKDGEALPHYTAAVNLYPAFAAAWQNMGKIHFDLKHYDEAGDCLSKAYELNEKKNPSLLYYAGVAYIMAKKERKALPHLEYLSSGEAGNPKTEWLEALLKVCMDLQLNDKAFDIIHALLDKNGEDPRWWKILARFHLQQSDYSNATAALTVRSYLTTIDRQDIMLLGDLNNAIGVPLKAAEYYEMAAGLENSPSSTYEKLASAFIAAHRMANAIEVLESTLEQKPTSRLWFMMGQVLYEEGSFDRAYNAFHHSVRHDPKSGRAYLMMGYCALQSDKKDAARAAFQKACRFPKQEKSAKKFLRQVATLSTSKQGM
ncbi:MAG: hypothetical protein BA872_05665 [Desulfobacterales bacterium C00003060]|nr:MAG: hypothetical protein BA872_05665 [Desulfobacterales bacterium C00003060]